MSISLIINGKKMTLEQSVSVNDYLAEKNLKPLMVVVEYNGVILSRNAFADTFFVNGDEIEIVQMMAGG